MLISKKMNTALNRQIGNEYGAMLQYVAIASWFSNEGLDELAAHFYRQADEEQTHAMRFVKYLNETGGKVVIPDLPSPRNTFKSARDAVRHALDQERKVTGQINDLVDLAIQESDHITRNTLNWFVDEQLEEVASMDNLLKVIERAGEQNLLYAEDYLARRAPAASASPEA